MNPPFQIQTSLTVSLHACRWGCRRGLWKSLGVFQHSVSNDASNDLKKKWDEPLSVAIPGLRYECRNTCHEFCDVERQSIRLGTKRIGYLHVVVIAISCVEIKYTSELTPIWSCHMPYLTGQKSVVIIAPRGRLYLEQRSLNKMAAISQTTFSNAFHWKNIVYFVLYFTEVCPRGFK